MNLQNLLDQFMGNAPANNQQSQSQQQSGQSGNDFMAQAQAALGSMAQRANQGGWTDGKGGGFAGGAVVGGLLGAVMGNKKMRKKAKKMGGGIVGYGGSAALGALALKAYQNYQASQSAPEQATPPPPQPAAIAPPQQAPFEVALLKSMISAAYADGHVDNAEREAIYGAVDRLSFDAEGKALVFDLLRNPAPIPEIAAYAQGPEQASALYVASLMAIDPDEPVEQRYLADLASAMNLPAGLKAQIEMEALGESLPAPSNTGTLGNTPPRFSGNM